MKNIYVLSNPRSETITATTNIEKVMKMCQFFDYQVFVLDNEKFAPLKKQFDNDVTKAYHRYIFNRYKIERL